MNIVLIGRTHVILQSGKVVSSQTDERQKTGNGVCHSRENIITHSEKALVNNIFSFFHSWFWFRLWQSYPYKLVLANIFERKNDLL